MRAVLDPNVIVSAALSRTGTPAKVLRAWLEGAYEVVVSPSLLRELQKALDYPKIARHVTRHEADELVDLLRRQAQLMDDPKGPPIVRSPDPDDDYLISLAKVARAMIVSGDTHLQSLGGQIPVSTPTALLAAEDQ